MARVFAVSRSGFYTWLKVAIRAAHRRSRETYGVRRLQPERTSEGFVAGRDRIARWRRELGLRGRQKRTFKATTNSNHTRPDLAGLKDVFTGEIVGYAMSERMTRALFRAVPSKRPPTGLIHPSDRGCQYGAHDDRALVDPSGLTASMSRKGNGYDHAPMESFWGSLKNEMAHHRRFATRAEAESAIRESIEIFYNRQRRHSRLGYVAPAVFVQNLANAA